MATQRTRARIRKISCGFKQQAFTAMVIISYQCAAQLATKSRQEPPRFTPFFAFSSQCYGSLPFVLDDLQHFFPVAHIYTPLPRFKA